MSPDPYEYPHPAEAGELTPKPVPRRTHYFIPFSDPPGFCVVTSKMRIVADCPTEDAARAALRLLSC